MRDAPPIPDPQASATPERVAALIEALLVVDAMARDAIERGGAHDACRRIRAEVWAALAAGGTR
ncbi:hypothetical protein [Crenalkalicoccus roseus]|uniref:hypothetical protein n=1 Tax=Crenalkalicoccus roseus TaxID=1485588 RepID=UPI0013050A79|nr:hypothetical protein [Crenalkalicoccus roseus]